MTYSPHNPLTRRSALLAVSAFVLSACSETIESVGESFGLITEGLEGVPISRSKVNSIPYASIAAKIGKGPRSLIILGRVNDRDLHWTTSDRDQLVTRDGRLVQTAGLQSNLRRTELLDPDPLAPLGAGKAGPEPPRFRRLVDLDKPTRYGIMLASSFEDLGPDSVVIAELEFETRHIRETCRARELDWRFENDYWVDPQHGVVWRSTQHFHPEMPPVEIDLLKPAEV